MSEKDYPILEFDPDREGVIEPAKTVKGEPLPPYAVLCFFQEVIEKLVREHGAVQVPGDRSEYGDHPFYRLEYQGKQVVFLHPGVGAAMGAGIFENPIARGVRNVVACGGAGVLDKNIPSGHVIVPVSAIRDEGASYHYMPPSREVEPDPAAVAAIERVLVKHKVPYDKGKTWTTDGFYRETKGKVKRRRAEGALTVEMEAAALFAVARFRGIRCGQILYGGDDVSSEEWDIREWAVNIPIRERLFWLAAEAAITMDKK